MAVRLKYAGLVTSKIVIEPGCRESLEVLGLQKWIGIISWLPIQTFTNMLSFCGKWERRWGNADQGLPSLS